MKSYKFIWKLISLDEKRKLFFILALIVGFSFIELLGVASVMPFLTILGSPEIIHENYWLSYAYKFFNFKTDKSFTVFVGLSICAIFILRAFYSILVAHQRLRYSNDILKSTSKKLIEIYLTISYQDYLKKNTSIMMKNITKEINVIRTTLLIFIEVVKEICTFLAISVTLFFIEPGLTLVSGVIFVLVFLVISKVTRGKLLEAGRESERSNRFVFKTGNESISGHKEIVLGQKYHHFVSTFLDYLDVYINANIRVLMLRIVPTVAIEAIFSVSIFIFIFYLMATKESLVEVLPILGVYAMAAQRVVPSLNKVNTGVAQLRSIRGGIEVLQREFEHDAIEIRELNEEDKLDLEDRITIKNLTFKYDGAGSNALDNVSLEIKKGQSIGIVGGSGSGKTTLVNTVLGLFKPDSGSIEVDGEILDTDNYPLFQKSISYIPQSIFLIDDTILSNIAFGVDEKDIDHEKVNYAVKAAQLDSLITKLPNGLNQNVGDMGNRISGGEKQRIGIARALYLDSSVIVLDEATSALDNETEARFQESVEKFSKDKTIIMIAHRISTIKNCDTVIVMDKGKIVAQGSYNSLMDNEHFKRISQLESRKDNE